MGLNDDRLSDREHSEMRDALLAGTQRIKPAGAHRTQFIAGALALVLIGCISGGAVATAAIVNAGLGTASVATPTPTPTPEPTPTPTATPTAEPEPEQPTGGVMPFGGECANVLNDDEVDAATGIPMMRSDYRWETGANVVNGSIDCLWVSEEVYLSATTHFYAYPEASAPEVVVEVPREAAGIDNGCVESAGDFRWKHCVSTRVVNGTWMQVHITGDSETTVTEEGAQQLMAAASERFDDFAAPVPLAPTSEWWALLDCNDLLGKIDPGLYGYERITLDEFPGGGAQGASTNAGTRSCQFSVSSGSGDTIEADIIWVGIVPGGATSFQTALDAEHSRPVTVEGAEAAVIAPGLDRYEGSASVLVVTDGVNILMVSPTWPREDSDLAPLAAAVLALMHP